MKKILLTMVAACVFLEDGCSAMQNPAGHFPHPTIRENVPHLRREVLTLHALANKEYAALEAQKAALETQKATLETQKATLETQKATAEARVPFDFNQAILDDQDVVQVDVKLGINALCGSILLGANFHGAAEASNRVALYNPLLIFLRGYSSGRRAVSRAAPDMASFYVRFADAIGNSDVDGAVAAFKIKGKDTANAAITERKKDALIKGITVENLRDAACVAAFNAVNAKGPAITAADCLWLGFCALAEIAEVGQLNGADLDGVSQPAGYNADMIKNLSGILAELK